MGSRSASGRKRDRTPVRIEACEGVVRRRAFYGTAANDTDTCDALGRAYAAGLLGEGDRARDQLNAMPWCAGQWRVAGQVPTRFVERVSQ